MVAPVEIAQAMATADQRSHIATAMDLAAAGLDWRVAIVVDHMTMSLAGVARHKCEVVEAAHNLPIAVVWPPIVVDRIECRQPIVASPGTTVMPALVVAIIATVQRWPGADMAARVDSHNIRAVVAIKVGVMLSTAQ
jgi:hypothetical protein